VVILEPIFKEINQKFLRGGPDASRGQFFQKALPLAAGGIDKK
jgi:hypothetical protein